MESKQYSHHDIIVTWEPSKCIHSTKCWRGLPTVFNPKKKPWIALEKSNKESIIQQINQCPSGAISYKYTTINETLKHYTNKNFSDLKVEVVKGGPLLIHGNFILQNSEQTHNVEAKQTALCRCGHSNKKPFCDGSHLKIEFDR
jgi:uncharacterized Fe-S cluster protein YjdI